MKTHLLSAIALSTTSLAAQWTQATPATSPSARAAAAMASDATGNIVLFGGDTGGFSPSGETWAYDGTTWSQPSVSGAPGGRAGAEMVYADALGQYVMYGGLNTSFFGGASLDQTWLFEPISGAWTQPAIVGATPGGTGLFGISYDAVTGRVVIYGGLPNNFFPIDSDQTWEFDGTAWTQYAVAPATNPGPLERPAMCFHLGLGRTVLFGGIDVQGSWNNDTWLYDGTTHTWSVLPIAGSKPAARTGAKMAYDAARGVCVLTGGADPADPTGNTYFTDTWEFDGATWTQVSTSITGQHLSGMMAYQISTNRIVQFGGIDFTTFTYRGATWLWETGTFGSGCAGTNGTPALSVSGSPKLGQPWTVTANNVNPTFNLGIVLFGFAELPGIDLGPILGMPGCLAFTTPDVLTSLLTGAGGSFAWTWPSVSGAVGDHFFAQALCLDPTVNAFGFTISNAISITVGN